ncbi:hypothetical protein LBW87_05400 [Herbaspirillum seropedicae]|nr:hypothetical protein [Herbaspirillum sp. alder98]
MGGLTGGAAQDALVGATVAGNAAANNFLKHQQFNEFKSRYAQCATDKYKSDVLADMRTLSDAQDVLLTKCTTVAACKELTRDIVYPTQQNGFLGFFITQTTDTYNFCAAGDGACMDTLKYISAHTNRAALTSIAPEFFAAVNWKTATIESGAAELEARFGLSAQAAVMLAATLSEMGQGGASFGQKAGTGSSAGVVPGRVQSRINLESEGLNHIDKRHFDANVNASQFSISKSELVDVGKIIGTDKFNGFQSTSTLTIMTDKFGSLVTAFLGKGL